MSRFANLVWSVARSVGLSETDAADVSQTTWLRFCEHLDHLQDPSHVGAWLVTTSRREAVRVSKIGGRQVVVDPWSWLERVDGTVDEPGAGLFDKERDIAVQCALAVMPERCRSLLLAASEEPPVPYDSVAARLGIAVGSVGPTRRRCLDHLRQLLEDLAPELVEGAKSPMMRS